MKPFIDNTSFGNITIAGVKYEHDVIIRLDGCVKKRKKKLSKARFGTSHKIAIEEARYIYDSGAQKLIIGSGQTGYVELSDEAKNFFIEKNCLVQLLPTPHAISEWNLAKGSVIAMFHVTC